MGREREWERGEEGRGKEEERREKGKGGEGKDRGGEGKGREWGRGREEKRQNGGKGQDQHIIERCHWLKWRFKIIFVFTMLEGTYMYQTVYK